MTCVYVIKNPSQMDGTDIRTIRVYLTEEEAVAFLQEAEKDRVSGKNRFMTPQGYMVQTGDDYTSKTFWGYRPTHQDYGFLDERDKFAETARQLQQIAADLTKPGERE